MKIGNIECYGVIYKIINTFNNKCYIGQTTVGFKNRYNYSGIGIEKVYKYHKIKKKYEGKYNEHLLKSIEKYGFDKWDIIEIYDIAFSREELDIKEKHYIKLFDCINNGYNHTEGGKNGKASEETKRKIGKNTKRMWENMTEEKINEMKRKISIATSGENNPMYGKNPLDYMTEEAKKERGRKISEANKGKNNGNAKSVICLTTKKIFYSSSEGAKYYNISTSSITCCCRGNCKRGGTLSNGVPLIWKFLVWKHNKKYKIKAENATKPQ